MEVGGAHPSAKEAGVARLSGAASNVGYRMKFNHSFWRMRDTVITYGLSNCREAVAREIGLGRPVESRGYAQGSELDEDSLFLELPWGACFGCVWTDFAASVSRPMQGGVSVE